MNIKSLIIFLFLSTFVVFGATQVEKVKNPNLKISFIDVGQGDSELIQDLKNKKTILVDTGVKKSGIVNI